MPLQNPVSGNATGLPAAKPSRVARSILSPTEWAEMHDCLTLALDALGDGPKDVDGPFLLNCIMHQLGALKLAHMAKERMEVRQ